MNYLIYFYIKIILPGGVRNKNPFVKAYKLSTSTDLGKERAWQRRKKQEDLPVILRRQDPADKSGQYHRRTTHSTMSANCHEQMS